jgi:hypothetical protein
VEKIIVSVGEPFWWFSVVVMGLLVSLAGTYLQRLLDGRLARLSKARAKKISQKQQARDERVNAIRNDDRSLALAIRKEHSSQIATVTLYALSILLFSLPKLFLFGTIVANFLATVLMMLGLQMMMNSNRLARELDEATSDV